jgi:hypothetical protein
MNNLSLMFEINHKSNVKVTKNHQTKDLNLRNIYFKLGINKRSS